MFERLINAIRSRRAARTPRPGVLVRPRRDEGLRSYPADGISPQRLTAILREADAGSLTAQS